MSFRLKDGRTADEIHFPGPCPFLFCLETGPHIHPVCPDCKAVRMGNVYCDICRAEWPDMMKKDVECVTRFLQEEGQI